VTGFIVEPGGFKGLVKFNGASIDVPDGRMDRVPPLVSDYDISQWPGEQSVALAVEPKTAIKLGHAVEVLGLQCGKGVDASWAYLAEGLDSFYRAEPVDCEKGLIGANAEQAAATHIQIVDRMIQRDIGERGAASATLIQRLTALRLFFDYLVEESDRSNNPVFRGGAIHGYGSAVFRSAGPIRRLHKLPWIPTDEEWRRILEVTRSDCLRDRTMLALAYDGSLRREELCSVAVEDFDFARKLLTVRAETTKTRRGRIVPYSSETSILLCRYVNRRRSMRAEPDALFLSESSRNRATPVTPYTWTKVVERIAERSKLPRFTTHTIRHLRQRISRGQVSTFTRSPQLQVTVFFNRHTSTFI
jgi:integrase